MDTPSSSWSRRFAYGFFFLLAVALGAGIAALLLNIFQRKEEGRQRFFQLVELTEADVDPAKWERNFPRQYDSYQRTVDVERTRHGGSEAIDKLAKDPLLKVLYAGYAFSIDFREERGHAYMLKDQEETDRVKLRKQPGACLHCHSAVLPAYRSEGEKRIAEIAKSDPAKAKGLDAVTVGFEVVCGMDWKEGRSLVQHPVTCQDCHDPQSIQLRVTRPAFLAGIAALAASKEPLPHLASIERWRKGDRTTPYDPNKEATRQEMRSFVCGQCHVEYYFRKGDNVVVYPWARGMKVEDVEAYYDDLKVDPPKDASSKDKIGFYDWVHAKTGTPVLKAQHPEFELWNQGTHARSGVACADCHMPYTREGAIKVSDHHVRSPMLNMSRACLTCHHTSEEAMQARVDLIQDRTEELLKKSEQAVADLIDDLVQARAEGRGDSEAFRAAQAKQRRAQFYVDFVLSENSLGFHAAQESARILALALNEARLGQLALAKK